MIPVPAVHDVLAEVAAKDRGRLVAYLSSRYGDLALAEDALSKAFLSALTSWPRAGIPAQPQAWLLTAARNAVLDEFRQNEVRARHPVPTEISNPEAPAVPDKRLELLFACAHPAIDPATRTPLMLQAIFGMEIHRIASAFVVTPDAMSQRLARAKRKIATARIPFRIPEPEELPGRLQEVLEAVYAAFSAGWDDLNGGPCDLASEAIWLARVLTSSLPGQAEAHGLLALLLHAEARRRARRTASGDFVPLSEQDCGLWSAPLQKEAERQLMFAHQTNSPVGRFQLEAAIQSAHASRAWLGSTPWFAIAALYDGLVRQRPSLGAIVGRAAAHGEAFGPERGLEALSASDAHKNRFSYQPYWACRAKLLRKAGNFTDAAEALQKAIALAGEPAIRRFLQRGNETALRWIPS